MRAYRLAVLVVSVAVAGCASMRAPKYENGAYAPPPAKNPLQVELQTAPCTGSDSRIVVGALVTVVGGALVNYAYDAFINWLDTKQANLSASSSGIATASFLTAPGKPKECLVLTRGTSLVAKFTIEPTPSGGYWHMKPYSLSFTSSEAKEAPKKEKSLVADIQFAALGADGKLVTYFQGTFDLGRHAAASDVITTFVGQDSGPYGLPKVATGDTLITTKVTASIVEHGEGRDWIRAVTDSLRKEENREKVLKPILDSLGKEEGDTGGKN